MNEKEEMTNEEFDNVIVLNDDEGNEVEFEWLDTLEVNDKKYVVVLPAEEDTDEVVILRLESNEEEDTFIGLDDEAEINEVFEAFKERNKENYDFED